MPSLLSEGGLVAEVTSLVPSTLVKEERVEKNPARRAALRKDFGPLTRSYTQWKPDRLLCIRFNVPNPFGKCVPTHSLTTFDQFL